MVVKKMGTTMEIRPPGSLMVKMELAKNILVGIENHMVEASDRADQLQRNVNNHNQLSRMGPSNSIESFQAAYVSVPFTIDSDSLPYMLMNGTGRSFVTADAAAMSMRIIEKRIIRIKMRNMHFMKDVFGEDGSMKLYVSLDGASMTWETEKMAIYDFNGGSIVSVWLSEDIEDLISRYGSRNSYRTANGEVVSVIGNFTILAEWTINAQPKDVQICTKLDRLQKFIMSEPFKHQVELLSSDGKTFKVSKAMLAASSIKIETQLQFSPSNVINPENLKSLKVFSGAYNDDDTDHYLDANGLLALVRYVAMNSILMPLEDPKLCLELMMTGNYNLIPDLEKNMGLILLAQPLELFDLETSIHLYWFASKRLEMEKNFRPAIRRARIVPQKTGPWMFRRRNRAGTKKSPGLPAAKFWDRLRRRALWNLKWTSIKDLLASSAIGELVSSPTEQAIREFMTTVKVE